MSNAVETRYRIPEQKFVTPEDSALWAALFKTRYWNDQLQAVLDAEKIPIEQLKILFPLLPKPVKTECETPIKLEASRMRMSTDYWFTPKVEFTGKLEIISPKMIPFSEILKRKRKPNLFGNSIVALDTSNPFGFSEETCQELTTPTRPTTKRKFPANNDESGCAKKIKKLF